MKIKRSEVASLIKSIKDLDEPIVLSSESDGRQKAVRLSIDGTARVTLSRNLKVLKAEQESIDEARRNKFTELATKEEAEAGQMTGANAVKFQTQVRAIESSEIELPLETIDIEELKLLSEGKDQKPNPVPLEILSNLLDVIVTGELKK